MPHGRVISPKRTDNQPPRANPRLAKKQGERTGKRPNFLPLNNVSRGTYRKNLAGGIKFPMETKKQNNKNMTNKQGPQASYDRRTA